MRRRLTLSIVACALVLGARGADAQVQFGADAVRDRSTFHFDNPSTYDTSEPVPHYFEQHYVRDNVWFTAAASYRAGIDWTTTFAATPTRQALATDYDTFFDPGGVTWVSGTTGDARMHSVRASQAVELGRAGAVRFGAGYRFTLDRADFLAGDKTDTRSRTLVSRSVVTTREYTSAQLHELFVSATATDTFAGAWQARLTGEVTPAAVNRLAIELPDKYPGQVPTYGTTNLTTQARLDIARSTGRWPIVVSATAARAWNYHASQRVSRGGVGIGVSVRWPRS